MDTTTRSITMELKFTKRQALFALVAAFMAWHPGFLGSETLTLTTYYPAPYGGYVSLLTTGRTILARDTDAVGIGGAPAANMTGNGQVVKLDLRGGGLEMDGGTTLHSRGRMHIDGEELLYLLNNSGVIVGKEWNGNGNLTVEGDLTVTGNIVGMCKTLSFSATSGWTGCGANYVMTQAYGTSTGYFIGLYDNLANFAGYASEYTDMTGTLICCRMS